MLEARLYHKTRKDLVAPILAEGLKYGVQGCHGQEDHAQKTNKFLDALCPDDLKRKGVDRAKCIYCYLCVNGRIFDVDSCRVIAQEHWDVGVDNAKLCLVVDPESAFISDLDLYDKLAHQLHRDTADNDLRELAGEYWRRLVSLADLRSYYHLAGDTLVIDGAAPRDLPARLNRVEVLLTRDVAAEDIRQTDHDTPR